MLVTGWLIYKLMYREFLRVRQIEDKLKNNEIKFTELFNHANDAIFLIEYTDDNGTKFIDVNNFACELLGFSREELMLKETSYIVHHDNMLEFSEIKDRIIDQEHLIFELNLINKNGEKIPTEVNSRIFMMNGRKVRLSIARDITHRKQVEEKMHYMAYHDTLTNLPNRRLFLHKIQSAINCAKNNGVWLLSYFLIWIDLNPLMILSDIVLGILC